jgi:hypothetical protein
LKKPLLGLLLVSSVALACAPAGRLAFPSIVEVGLLDSVSEKYAKIQSAVVAHYGGNAFEGEAVQIAVTMEGTFLLGLFSNVTIITFEKSCEESLFDAFDDLVQEYAGEPGGGDVGDGYFTDWGDDVFADCYASVASSPSAGSGVDMLYHTWAPDAGFPSLVCPGAGGQG